MATPLRPPPADKDWLATEYVRAGPPRTPVLAKLARAGRALAARINWAAARTPVLALAGFGCLTAAAWAVAVPLGLAAAGVSLLLLEVLSGDDKPAGRR